jgi:hypothetical protein
MSFTYCVFQQEQNLNKNETEIVMNGLFEIFIGNKPMTLYIRLCNLFSNTSHIFKISMLSYDFPVIGLLHW